MKKRILIKAIGLGRNKFYIELNSNEILTLPYSYTSKLEKATLEELSDYKFIANEIDI